MTVPPLPLLGSGTGRRRSWAYSYIKLRVAQFFFQLGSGQWIQFFYCSHMDRKPNPHLFIFKSFLFSRKMHQWVVSCVACTCVAAVFTVSVEHCGFITIYCFSGWNGVSVFVTWSQWISCTLLQSLPACLLVSVLFLVWKLGLFFILLL